MSTGSLTISIFVIVMFAEDVVMMSVYPKHATVYVQCDILFHPANHKKSVLRRDCHFTIYDLELDEDGFFLPTVKRDINIQVVYLARERYATDDFVIQDLHVRF